MLVENYIRKKERADEERKPSRGRINPLILMVTEPANASVGFIVGFKADVFDDAPQILQRGDIVGRVGTSNYVDIPPLPAVSDVKTFLSELLTNLVDQDKVQAVISEHSLDTELGVYPLVRSAFELLADYATQDISRALPRYIINAVNECAIQAWDDGNRLVDDRIVNSVAQFLFV
jgi:hypothetical protein